MTFQVFAPLTNQSPTHVCTHTHSFTQWTSNTRRKQWCLTRWVVKTATKCRRIQVACRPSVTRCIANIRECVWWQLYSTTLQQLPPSRSPSQIRRGGVRDCPSQTRRNETTSTVVEETAAAAAAVERNVLLLSLHASRNAFNLNGRPDESVWPAGRQALTTYCTRHLTSYATTMTTTGNERRPNGKNERTEVEKKHGTAGTR